MYLKFNDFQAFFHAVRYYIYKIHAGILTG